MTESRTDIARAAVLRGPREVAEDEAGSSVAALYARLRELLGVPFVPTVFRMLAVHEDYLAAVVDAASATPAERRATYARRGVGLAADVARDLDPGSVSAGEDTAAIQGVIERYNVANPAGMLILAALSDGLEPARVLEAPLPERAGRSLLDDVLMCHGGFTVPGLWRELAHGWPDVAERAWTEIRSLAQAPRFASGRDELLALASEALPAASFPRADRSRRRTHRRLVRADHPDDGARDRVPPARARFRRVTPVAPRSARLVRRAPHDRADLANRPRSRASNAVTAADVGAARRTVRGWLRTCEPPGSTAGARPVVLRRCGHARRPLHEIRRV